MNVSKLTITPCVSKGLTYVIDKPVPEEVSLLVTERLSIAGRDEKQPRIFRKIPKFLKGFVNPKSKVSPERKFLIDI